MKFTPTSLAIPFAVLSATAVRADVTYTQAHVIIDTGAANDDITINVGPAAGQVEVVGAGTGSGTYFGVRGIVAFTRDGEDVINVLGSSAFLPRLFLNLGAQKGTVNVDFSFQDTGLLPFSAAGIVIRTGEGDDDIDVTLRAANLPTRAFLDVDLGGGNNSLDADLEPLTVSPSLELVVDVTGGAGIDDVELDVGDNTTFATAVLRGNLGAGNDDVDICVDSISSGATSLHLDLELGEGQDSLTANGEGPDLTLSGSLSGGSGSDTIEILSEAGFLGGVAIRGGAGSDSIKLNAAGSNLSASTIDAGEGNDIVEVLVQNGTTQTATTSDGGPGFDVFFGIGAVVNFEEINR